MVVRWNRKPSKRCCPTAKIAFLDVREHGQFGDGHPFFANSVPYSKFEVRLVEAVPVPSVRMVL